MQSDDRAVAVVGMACRFADAPDAPTLWQNILERRTSFKEPNPHRWNPESFYSPNRRAKNGTYAKTAAQLSDIESFAGPHFQISPKRAHHMDPQQRLMLEVSREALQDAGLERRPWNRQDSAVFVGVNLSEYGNLLSTSIRVHQMAGGQFGSGEVSTESCSDITVANAYTLLGSNISMCASCLAQYYDCQGPALAVDAACAASMAATVQGVQYLRGLAPSEGPSPVALIGGVYLLLVPDNSICFSKLGALAESECRPFDAAADGFVLGEGAATVVLKRYRDAVRDGDRIYSVIRGVAWNNDGVSSSPATPSERGQIRVMEAGLRDAGFSKDSIDYIECHGTGTAVGDPIELASLHQVFPHRPENKIRLGSVKANIGHTIAASGLAGLIRASYSLYHEVLPPQAGWESWHSALEAFCEPFEISAKSLPWTSEHRRAVVSSFAFGGTNCFVALEGHDSTARSSEEEDQEQLLFSFSAPNPKLLSRYLAESRARLALPRRSLKAAARTLASRTAEGYLGLVLASSRRELLERMDEAMDRLQEPPDVLTLVTPELLLGPATDEQRPQWEQAPAMTTALELVLAGQYEQPLQGGKGPLMTLPHVPLVRQKYWFTKSLRKHSPPKPPERPERSSHPLIQLAREALELPQDQRLEQAFSLEPSQQARFCEHWLKVSGHPWSEPGNLQQPTSLLDLVELCQGELCRHPGPEQHPLSAESQPYLLDHALRGRPLLPLAGALDLIAYSLGLSFPIAFSNIQVKRGLLVPRPTEVAVRRDGSTVQLVELRAKGREVVAFEATLLEELPPPPTPPWDSPQQLRPPRMSLRQFYDQKTFHGPMLQGVLDIFGVGRRHLEGRVCGGAVGDWIPDSPRLAWNLDPLLVDSALQLAMFWCLERAGQGLLPVSIDELVLLAPFGLRTTHVRVALESVDEDGVSGEFQFHAAGQLRAWMRGAKGKFVPPESLRPAAKTS